MKRAQFPTERYTVGQEPVESTLLAHQNPEIHS